MVIVFVLYLVALLAITVYTARLAKTSTDFISGSRKIVSGMSWALGYTGQPQLLTRMMMIRNARDYRKAKWVAGIWTRFAFAMAVLISLLLPECQAGRLGIESLPTKEHPSGEMEVWT
jgi:sodium/proline symporter